MSVRYIGSKARVVDALAPLIGRPQSDRGVFVDAFCGTGVVAAAAARQGWAIRLNDHLLSAVIMAVARLLSKDDVPFSALGGYVDAINKLNDVPASEGFIWKEYSPASALSSGVTRMYFTEENASRIDGMRDQIALWRSSSLLTEAEEALLIADLLAAVNSIANIAGTYGCFLSYWSPKAGERILVRPRALLAKRVSIEMSVMDVSSLRVGPEDVVYLDPPYTKRQYAAYYHILETIAVGDRPRVAGVTGLRPWRVKASEFCYKQRALNALVGLVSGLSARRVLISYSNEGHIELDPLIKALSMLGNLTTTPLKQVGRYRPNRVASAARSKVTEYLIALEPYPRNAEATPDERYEAA